MKDELISLFPNYGETQLSLEKQQLYKRDERFARDKAAKSKIALARLNVDVSDEELSDALVRGDYKEEDIRARASAAKLKKEQEEARKIIETIDKAEEFNKDVVELAVAVNDTVSSKAPDEDKDTILEEEYGNVVADTAITHIAKRIPDKAQNVDLLTKSDIVADVITKQEIILDAFAKAKQAYNEQSSIGAAVDFMKFFVPFYEAYKTWEVGDIINIPTSTVLIGNNKEEIYQQLLFLPPKEFKKTLNEIVEALAKNNPQQSMYFVAGLLDYTKSDKFLDNSMGIADAITLGLPAFTKGIKVGSKLANRSRLGKIIYDNLETNNKLKKFLKANADSVKKEAHEVLDASGMQEEAGVVRALGLDGLEQRSYQRPVGAKEAEKVFGHTGLFDPERYLRGIDDVLDGPVAEKLKESIKFKAQELKDVLFDPETSAVRIQRIPLDSPRFFELVNQAKDELFKTLDKKAENGVIDVRPVHSDKTVDNVNKVEILFGNWHKRTGFDTEYQAKVWASRNYKFIKDSYDIVERNGKYYIRYYQDIDETKAIHPDLIETGSKVKEKNPVTAVFSRLLSAENILGEETTKARKTFVYSAQKIIQKAEEAASAYLVLGKKSRKDFNRFMDHSLRSVDNEGNQGVTYNNVTEFVNAWSRMFGRQPNKKEIETYFSFKLLLDFDYVVRNLALRRELARAGVKRVAIRQPGTSNPAYEFNGKFVDDIPWNSQNEAFIAFVNEGGHPSKLIKKNDITKGQREILKEAIDSGDHVVIQLANAGELPFYNTFKRIPIHFVVAPKSVVKEGPLPFKLVNYNPGAGHQIYRDNFFTKIPLIRKTRKGFIEYHGDFTIASHTTEAAAKEFAKHVEVLISKFKSKASRAEIEAYIRNNGLPFDYDEFENIYEAVKSTVPVRPVLALPDGAKSFEILKNDHFKELADKFINLAESPWDLVSNRGIAFAGRRDYLIPRVVNYGTEANPAFRVEEPRLLDPMKAIAKTVHEDVNLLLLQDYKNKAIQDFVNQFGDVLLNYDPKINNVYEVFAAPKWDKKAPRDRLLTAQKAYLTIKNLWETPHYMDDFIAFAKKNILNAVDKRLGANAAEFVNDRMIPFMKDPITKLRAFTFHAKIGLFNMLQLFQQAMGFVNITAHVNPKHALPAFVEGQLLLAEYYSRVGAKLMKKKRFDIFRKLKLSQKGIDMQEMIDTFERSGFARIGNEYADLDTITDPALTKTTGELLLESGKLPFKAGERFTRSIAWAAAFREWKYANGFKKVDKQGLREILARADDLIGRMSAASKNKLQEKGIWSIPTQFWTYQLHITEMAWEAVSKNPEKFFQIMAAYTLFFGVDDATAVFTTIPITDSIKKYLIEYDAEHGTNYSKLYDSPFINFILTEGIVGLAGNAITNKQFDFSGNLGLNGLAVWEPLFNIIKWGPDIGIEESAKEIVNVLIGAPGKTIVETLNMASPIIMNLVYAARGDFDMLGLSPDDWLTITQPFTSANNVARAALIRAYGKYLTKQKGYLDASDYKKLDRIMVTLGFKPSELNDSFLKIKALKSNRELAKRYWKQEATKAARLLAEAVRENNKSQIEYYKKKIAIILEAADLTPMEKGDIIWGIIKDNKDLIREAEDAYKKLILLKHQRGDK